MFLPIRRWSPKFSTSVPNCAKPLERHCAPRRAQELSRSCPPRQPLERLRAEFVDEEQKSPRRRGRLLAALLPIGNQTLRHAGRCREGSLRQPEARPDARDVEVFRSYGDEPLGGFLERVAVVRDPAHPVSVRAPCRNFAGRFGGAWNV